jgi:hypothetical protein
MCLVLSLSCGTNHEVAARAACRFVPLGVMFFGSWAESHGDTIQTKPKGSNTTEEQTEYAGMIPGPLLSIAVCHI